MRRFRRVLFRLAMPLAVFGLAGCETLPESISGIGQEVFGEVVGDAAASASFEAMQGAADQMCSADNALCQNLTMTAISGFTESFIEGLAESDVRRINDAKEEAIESGEETTWSNPETGASGTVQVEPAEPKAPEPTEVSVKKDTLEALPLMQAVGQQYVIASDNGANVRGGPGTGYAIVEKLLGRQQVLAIGKVVDEEWYLVGKGQVGIGYVFGELMERWVAPPEEDLDETMEALAESTPPAEETELVQADMSAECFTTTQAVTLSDGTSETATVTSCRTPTGWAQV